MILKFAASARAAGMRISTAEVLDCLDQLPRVDILDEAQFTTLLRSHFAKSRLEQSRFAHLYHLFFHEMVEDLDPSTEAAVDQIEAVLQELMAHMQQNSLSLAVAEFLANRPEAYLRWLNEMRSEGEVGANGPRGLAANAGGLVRRLEMLQAIRETRVALDDFLVVNRTQIHGETRSQLRRLIHRRLDTAYRLMTSGQRQEFTPPAKIPVPDLYGELGRRSFAGLSPGEMARLRDVITRLVRMLRDAAGRRHKARSRGVVDMRRTLRAAAQTQGVPLSIKFRHRPLRKGGIVVLCDVSGSVWSSARFMLTMLYALQDCFDRVRSFVFIDEPVEVTHYFDDFDVDRALEEILHSPDVAHGAATDYGRTLRLFKRSHMETITKKTTVIVIGDGRSNYGNPEADIFEEIRDHCRRLFWLNPETEQFWYSGDSEMRTYETLCNEVHQCQNLNQLTAFIRNLVI